jgi:hypothetical protein
VRLVRTFASVRLSPSFFSSQNVFVNSMKLLLVSNLLDEEPCKPASMEELKYKQGFKLINNEPSHF